MRIELTHTYTPKSPSERRVILLFAGWGMDAGHFCDINAHGYDMMVAYDYSDGADVDGVTLDALKIYSEIVVIGWSFGVPVANRFISRYDSSLPITLTIAVNGTLWPVDDLRGIPVAIFRGTLDGLSERTLEKFRRRMTRSSEALSKFLMREPARSLESLRRELIAIEALPAPTPARWDIALVSSDDRIIPPAAQLQAWREAEAADITTVDGSHYPDLSSIFDRYIKDKELVESRFTRSHATYDDSATVQRTVAQRVARLADEAGGIEGKRLLEAGCGTGLLTRELLTLGTPHSLKLWDLTHPATLPEQAEFKVCDAETEIERIATGSIDTIVAASTVQWFNSLQKFLVNSRRAVSPGGLMVLSTFGPDTFADIYRITGSGLPSMDAEQLARIARKCGWTVEAVETDRYTLSFESVLMMLRHMRLSGVNGVSSGSMADIVALNREYPVNEKGRIDLVYQPIYLVLRYGQKE